MDRKLLKTVQKQLLLFGIVSRTPWEPVADPLWSADPSLKTAVLQLRVSRHGEVDGKDVIATSMFTIFYGRRVHKQTDGGCFGLLRTLFVVRGDIMFMTIRMHRRRLECLSVL